jgi:hypothetical protein
MRDAVLADGDELAVDDRVGLHAFKRSRDLDVGMADDLSVAAIERDFAAVDLRDHPEAVILVLEYPLWIVKGGIRERRQHRLQALR